MSEKTISDLANQIRGVSYNKRDLHDKLDENSIILLRANNIVEGKLNFKDVVYVDKSVVAADQYLKDGDILISASSGSKKMIGKAASFHSKYKCTFGAFCKVVRPHDDIKEFLSIYFQSATYRREISHLALGANINNIRNEHINSLQVQVPDYVTRLQMIKVINKLQKIRDVKKQKLKKLDALIKARFVEMFGDPIKVQPDIQTWSLKSIATVKSSHRIFTKEFVNSGVPFYRGTEISMLAAGNIPKHPYYISRKRYDEIAADDSKPKIGDLLLPSICDKGQVWLVNTDKPFYYKDGRVLCISLNKQKFNPIFFHEYMKLKLKAEYSKLGSGSTFAEFKIFQLKKLKIFIPSMKLQNEFANFVQQVDKSKFENIVYLNKTLSSKILSQIGDVIRD